MAHAVARISPIENPPDQRASLSLAAVGFSRDERRAWNVASQVIAGTVWVTVSSSAHLLLRSVVDEIPGSGREGGSWSFDSYCSVKNTTILKDSFA